MIGENPGGVVFYSLFPNVIFHHICRPPVTILCSMFTFIVPLPVVDVCNVLPYDPIPFWYPVDPSSIPLSGETPLRDRIFLRDTRRELLERNEQKVRPWNKESEALT